MCVNYVCVCVCAQELVHVSIHTYIEKKRGEERRGDERRLTVLNMVRKHIKSRITVCKYRKEMKKHCSSFGRRRLLLIEQR